MVKREKRILRQLIDERGVKDMAGVQNLVKELTSGFIQEIMDSELEDSLGYSKYDYRNKSKSNSRNGSYKKTVHSSQGDIDLHVPRDRAGPLSFQNMRWTYPASKIRFYSYIFKEPQPVTSKKR